MKDLDEEKLDEAVARLREGLEPEAIYLYGSHAYGQPHEDSDVDLLVIVGSSDKPSYERAAEAYGLLGGLKFPVELKVVTREEFDRLATWQSSVERQVKEKGIELYAAG